MAFRMLSFRRLIRSQAQAAQGSTGILLNFQPGSVLRAIFEANAGVGLWMQWLIVLVLRRTRAATSQGADLDTWLADYGFTRLPGAQATGYVTFARLSANQPALILPGVQMATLDGTQAFQVTTDTTNAAWSTSAGASPGFLIAAGVFSLAVPVQALVFGSGGNVAANTVTVLQTAVPYVDSITNASNFTSGADAETDAAARARFRLFVDSRSRGTISAYAYAIQSLRQGLDYSLAENTAADGTFCPGFVTVTIDDGSGAPPAPLLASVSAAVDQVRALSTSFAVQPPSQVVATVSLIISTVPAYSHSVVTTTVANAILAYINALPIGTVMPFAALAQLAMNTTGVRNVSGITLNGGTADIGGGPSQVVRATSLTVAVA